MRNQRICIVGDGLAGLTTALRLKNLNLDIDLYVSSQKPRRTIDRRTTAISDSNYKFMNNCFENIKNDIFWPCKKINLYYENEESYFNFLNLEEKKRNLMYIFENHKLKKLLKKNLKKSKVNFIKKQITNLKKIENYYDLVFLCMGNNSKFYDSLLNTRPIRKDYKEIAITGYLTSSIKLINSKQYFLKEGPLAFLPFSRNTFSFVWSLDRNFFLQNKENLKKIVLEKVRKIINKKINLKISPIDHYPLHLNLKTKYYKKNTMILGEGLHSVHPLAGQGFNLVLRDIQKLYEIIKKNSQCGLTFKDSSILSEFYNSRKPENILLGLGINFTHGFFKRNKFFDPAKQTILNNISKLNEIKRISKIVSNKGFF